MTSLVINTRDVITFQGDSVAELKQAFHESVDDYLEFCETRGETSDKLFSGQLVTRISPDLHRQVKVAAVLSGNSLNACVAEQLAGAVLRIGAVQATGTKSDQSQQPNGNQRLSSASLLHDSVSGTNSMHDVSPWAGLLFLPCSVVCASRRFHRKRPKKVPAVS